MFYYSHQKQSYSAPDESKVFHGFRLRHSHVAGRGSKFRKKSICYRSRNAAFVGNGLPLIFSERSDTTVGEFGAGINSVFFGSFEFFLGAGSGRKCSLSFFVESGGVWRVEVAGTTTLVFGVEVISGLGQALLVDLVGASSRCISVGALICGVLELRPE